MRSRILHSQRDCEISEASCYALCDSASLRVPESLEGIGRTEVELVQMAPIHVVAISPEADSGPEELNGLAGDGPQIVPR